MQTKMTRSNAIEHMHDQLGIYAWDWEEGDPEPTKYADMSNEELLEAFCLSGVFNHVFDGTGVAEPDFEIVND